MGGAGLGSAELIVPVARRVLYCVPGAWTDAWYDDPSAWWQWCCAFTGWPPEPWQTFYGRWRTASEKRRRQMMDATGLHFFDWQRVPGGSTRGSIRVAAGLMAEDLARLPADADVTLLGHSKGGNAIKLLLTTQHGRHSACSSQAGRSGAAKLQCPGGEGEGIAGPPHPNPLPKGEGVPRPPAELLPATGARPARAILVDAPVDWLREAVSRLMRLGVEHCRLSAQTCSVPCVTVNNWLDPSGGRLKGVRNYQTFIWQDYLSPYPPHGMKGFLAERVLRDVGALARQ